MLRGTALALLCLLAASSPVVVQEPAVLRIRIVLQADDRTPVPVRRHVLLISDNPSSAPPRRVLTSVDGTVEVRLAPGNYTVESDRPVAFGGKAYQWVQTIDVTARGATLELNPGNAEIEASVPADAASPVTEDRSSLTTRWQDSVAAVWTPTDHASGFLIDRNGLVVTNQRPVGAAARVEVQLSLTLKVPGDVIAADAARDVTVVRVDPASVASIAPVPLGCGAEAPAPANGDEVFAMEAPLRQDKGATDGVVRRVGATAIEADLSLSPGGAGGPVFSTRGTVVGITSMGDSDRGSRRGDARVVPIGEVCAVVAQATAKMKDRPPSSAGPLPIEPARPFPAKALEAAVAVRAGTLNPYQITSSDFDVSFLTPVHVYAGQKRAAGSGAAPRQGGGMPDAGWLRARLVTDFGNWSEYVADVPPVLMIRVTPRLVESFWAKMARGAAYTQGMALPALKRLRSGFSRMRVTCGDAEITPIHPFIIEEAISETDTIAEGLYVFDPAALTPDCDPVRLTLYSAKEPNKADTRVVDAKVLRQIWDDFAPYRGEP